MTSFGAPANPGRAPITPRLDRDSFERVYGQHSKAVFNTAFCTAGADLASDITQETFMRYWQYPERFDPTRGSIRMYLLTIAHKLGVDTIRSRNARRVRENRTCDSFDQPAHGVDHDVLRGERVERLLRAVERLSPEHRTVIITICYGECTYKSAALILDIPEGTVKSRIRAAFTELRYALHDPDTSAGASPIGTPAIVR